MRKIEEVADPFPLYQPKKDCHFIGVLAYGQSYIMRYSALDTTYNFEIQLAQPEQTEKFIHVRKDTHARTLYSQLSVCRAQ